MPLKRYSVVVADRSTGVIRRVTVSLRPPALVALVSILALPVLMALGARWSVRIEMAELRSANVALEMENESYRAATGQLATQVSSLQAAINELGERSSLDPTVQKAMDKLPAIVKSSAIGGGSARRSAADPVVAAAVVSPENTFGVLRDLLGLLESRLETVRYGVERRQALAAATPSIWPAAGWLSSSFGNRTDPFTSELEFHPGIDISADRGTAVYATADGVVDSAGYSGNYGNLVVLTHGFGLETRYGHLSRFTVRSAQPVKRGELLGYIGSTGRSTSPHVHYEVWLNGRLLNPLRILATRRP